MSSINSQDNYLINQNPNQYGGQQSDYVARSQAIVQEAIKITSYAKKQGKDLKQVFFRLFDKFATTRHEIALAHQTKNANDFGRKRFDVTGDDVSFTTLSKQYAEFHHKLMPTFQKLLKGAIPLSGFPEKDTFTFKETFLGRISTLTIELYSEEKIKKLQWNKTDLDDPQEVLTMMRQYERPEAKAFVLTPKEKEQINHYNKVMQEMKRKYPLYHEANKMQFILEGMANQFPAPIFVESLAHKKKPTQDTGLYIRATLRVQIQDKLYAMSQYVTWTYQDNKTDSVERMKDSKIVIIHQDRLLIEESLKEIAAIFEKAVLWDSTKEDLKELKDQVALLRYFFAHVMPLSRGSAGVGEWYEKTVYGVQGFECTHQAKTLGDLEAFTAPLPGIFRKSRYEATIELKKMESSEQKTESKKSLPTNLIEIIDLTGEEDPVEERSEIKNNRFDPKS